MSTVNTLFTRANDIVNSKNETVIERLLNHILHPPTSSPRGTCLKHYVILPEYRRISVLKTKFNRLYFDRESISFEALQRVKNGHITLRKKYRATPCTCGVDLPRSHTSRKAICMGCKKSYETINNCRQPLHLAFKQNGFIPTWTDSSGNALAFDVGSD